MTPPGVDRDARTVGIVGATGWIGRALVADAARAGHPVVALTRRPADGFPTQVEVRVTGAVEDGGAFARHLDGVDVLINAAGAAHVSDRTVDETAVAANERLPAVIGDASQRVGLPRLVHLSSIKAVGEQGRLQDTDEPRPMSHYGRSKLAGERALTVALAGSGTKLVIVRPPMVYGPEAPANFSRLVRLVRSPLPVPLLRPFPVRSVVHRANLTALLLHLATAADLDTSPAIVHAADLPQLTTRDLVRCIADATGSRGWVLPLPRPLVATVLRALGRGDDVDRLSRDLVVVPSPVPGPAVWQPRHPEHRGFMHLNEASS